MRLFVSLFLLIGSASLHAQQNDSVIYPVHISLADNKSWIQKPESSVFLKPSVRSVIIPATLITYGFVSLQSKGLKAFDNTIKKEVREDADFKTPIDNYLQYAPALAVYG